MKIISQMDINKRLAALQEKTMEELKTMIGGPSMMYGTEIPFYFLYKDAADAEGVKQTHIRLLDLELNRDDVTKPYMFGDIAISMNVDDYYVVSSDVKICIIQAETPDNEQHHVVVLFDEVDKVFTILKETMEAGKEVTIKFHSVEVEGQHDAG